MKEHVLIPTCSDLNYFITGIQKLCLKLTINVTLDLSKQRKLDYFLPAKERDSKIHWRVDCATIYDGLRKLIPINKIKAEI